MLSIVNSFGLNGLEGYIVKVEVDISVGMPCYETVGLVDTAVKEGKERIRAGIKNSGYKYPIGRITINLAPADTKKEGSIYDVAVALGILSAMEEVDKSNAQQFAYLGELSLVGKLRKINGVLPILIAAKELKINKIFIPKDNEDEASYIEGLEVYAVDSLNEIVDFLNHKILLFPVVNKKYSSCLKSTDNVNDFKFVKGQAKAKRALEIAAAGGHNVMMIGPPGAGKTMLARCFSSILPDLTFKEALECSKIHSVAGVLDSHDGIIVNRPFRSPHHTATVVALIGGGTNSKPGEISLAHNGVLFLDELPEYPRHTVETLRQPLEDGVITISRNKLSVEYPANFTLLASMNPCPCGYYGSLNHVCRCSQSQILKYLNKLSGPLLDRIDIHMEVEGVSYDELSNNGDEEPSSEIRKRVNVARNIQLKRYEEYNICSNSQMSPSLIKKFCSLDDDSESLLKEAFETLNLSARGHNRILKVSRTIADLENSENIEMEHIAEAIGYRSLDKKYIM